MKDQKIDMLINRVFYLALEFIISLVVTLAVFTFYRDAGFHHWWSTVVERLL